MGIKTREEVQQEKPLYIYLASKKDSDELGLYMQTKGVKTFIGELSGELTNIQKVLKKPKADQKFEAYFSYQFTFFDPESNPSNMILDISQENFYTVNILNTLATVEHPGNISIKTAKKSNGHLGIWFKNNGEKLDWKYKWDADKGGFETIPLVKKTFLRKDATGKDVFDRDKTEQNEFLDGMLAEIYTTFSGQQWSGLNVLGNNSTNPTMRTKKLSSTAKAILDGVRKYMTTPADFLLHWNETEKGLPARLKRDITDSTERGTCKAQLQTHFKYNGCRKR